MYQEKRLEKLRKIARLSWLIIPLAACGMCTTSVAGILFGGTNQIASVDFGNGYNIRIWDEIDGIADPNWDPDHSDPDIYYEITKSGDVIVSQSGLTINNFKSPFDIKVVFAEEGNLVCVYDTKYWGFGVFVMFDIAKLEGWPSSDSSSNDEQHRWIERYKQLQQENPDLPPYYF